MIDKTTYSGFWEYVQRNKRNLKFFWALRFTNNVGAYFRYTNSKKQIDEGGGSIYVPSMLEVTPIIYKADLYRGSYNVNLVHVKIENLNRPQANTTYKRFSDYFSSYFFETYDAELFIHNGTDSIPVYKGYMINFKHTFNTIEFDIVKKSELDLPTLPKNYITRDDYPDIGVEFIDKPIPIIYGKWSSVTSNLYREKVFIPAYIIENKLDQTTPQLVLEVAGHELYYIDDLVIYDDKRHIPGYIQDTVTKDAANARITLTLNSYDILNFLTAIYYFYPNRGTTDGTFNIEDIFDGDFSTKALITGDESYAYLLFPEIEPYSEQELRPQYQDSTGQTTIELEAIIQLSGYPKTAFSSGEYLKIEIANSNFSQTFDYNFVNSLIDTNSFNIDSDNLQLTYNYKWDGSTKIFTIREADNEYGLNPLDYSIIPSQGIYWTMNDFRDEIEKKISEASTTNTYAISYNKDKNKFAIKVINGSKYFKIIHETRSDDIGFTTDSSNWTNTYQESDSPTILDVPDGDFGKIKLRISANILQVGGSEGIYIKEARIKILRKYQTYYWQVRKEKELVRWEADSPRRGRYVAVYNWVEKYYKKIDVEKLESVLEEIEGSNFFVTCFGRKFGSWIDDASRWNIYNEGGLITQGPYICESLLRDEASLGNNDIDMESFDTAVTNMSTGPEFSLAHHLYIDKKSDLQDILNTLMRFSRGFIFVNHAGKYKAICLKYSYSSADFTVYLRDIKEPLNENLIFERTEISNMNKDLSLYYLFDPMTQDYKYRVTKSVTTGLNIPSTEIYSNVIQSPDSSADYGDRIAKYFCGDGATKGQFGELKKIISMTTLNPEFHFAEIGDIVQFDNEFDSKIKCFGKTLSNIYFMIIEKQFDLQTIKLKLMEVG